MNIQEITTPNIVLNNNTLIPQIGLGVLKAKNGGEVEKAVESALNAGYRMIDTASKYGNEAGVGLAISNSSIRREEIFLTTKIWNSDQGYEETLQAFKESLKRLKTTYVDLLLIHWPVENKYLETWKALEELYRSGLAKAIGVSNFQVHHLENLLQNATIKPMVNQIEMHPYLQQNELVNFSKQHNIQLQAWRPIMMGEVMKVPKLQEIGAKYGMSPVQVTLKWLLKRGVIIIPKSVNKHRIKENIDLFNFDLTDEEMDSISKLNRNQRLGPDPDNFNF